MPAAPTPSSKSESTAARPSLVARLVGLPLRVLAGLRRNWLLAVVLCCGLTIIGIAGISYAVHYSKTHQPPTAKQVLAEAQRAVDAKQMDEARHALAQMPEMAKLSPVEQAHSLYLMGRIVATDAEKHGTSNDARVLYLVASRYLEEANDRGLPAKRQADGMWQLGRCLFASGQYAECLPALRAAAKNSDEHHYELYRMLSLASLRTAAPNLRSAQQYSQSAREVPDLTTEQREDATLLQAQILLQLGNFAASRQLFQQVPADSAHHDTALVGEAQCLLLEGTKTLKSGDEGIDLEAARGQIREALTTLEPLRKDTQATAWYLSGLGYQALGDPDTALKLFQRTEEEYFSTPAGFAALLNKAEMLQKSKTLDASLESFTRLVEQVPDSAAYDNPWVSLSELRDRLATALQRYLETNNFASALALCVSSEKILAIDVRTEVEADAHRAWGEYLMREAANGPRRDATKESAARQHFRRAGEAFARLTELRFTAPSYTDCLWKSGDCYLKGQNFDAAILLLRQFLEHAPPPQHPQGLVGIGEAQLSLGRHHEALQALEECITSYPKHPESYEARLLASQAYQELAQRRPAADAKDAAAQRAAALAKAKQLLQDNLGIDDELAPSSLPFQKSMFAYGTLLYREGMAIETTPEAAAPATEADRRRQELAKLSAANAAFQEATAQLGEAVERYPDAPEAALALFHLAEANLHAAKLPETSLKWEQTAKGRAAMKRDREALLTTAEKTLALLQTRLLDRQRTEALSDVELALLRNVCFMHPDTLYALGQYQPAIEAYAAAINHYKDSPESLDALVQIALCQRRLAAPEDARGTLQQAKVMLQRIPADQQADFEKTTRYSRAEWDSLITWLAQL